MSIAMNALDRYTKGGDETTINVDSALILKVFGYVSEYMDEKAAYSNY